MHRSEISGTVFHKEKPWRCPVILQNRTSNKMPGSLQKISLDFSVKNGNRLLVNSPLFLQATLNIFIRYQGTYIVFGHLQRCFLVLLVNITLPYFALYKKKFYKYRPVKITASELPARCQVLYRKIYEFFTVYFIEKFG